jgi:hypothetical protein
MGNDDTDDDSAFQPAPEIREPDWSSDDTSTDTGGSTDDDAFRMPPEIREPDWSS